MTLPENFSPFEHLQSTVSQVLRYKVRKEFSDVGGDDWEPDISTPRSSLRLACTPDDNDTADMLRLRWGLFFDVVRGGQDFAPQVYALDQKGLEASVRDYPIVKNFFIESRYDASSNERVPVRRQVSFRWREDNFSSANVIQLANKIKADLATPPLKWKCGRILFTYLDKSKPYNFQVYAYDKPNAKKAIEAAIRIQDDIEPDWNRCLKTHEPEDLTPPNETKLIEGDTVILEKGKEIADLEFGWSELYYPYITKPRYLVDATGTKPGAIHYV